MGLRMAPRPDAIPPGAIDDADGACFIYYICSQFWRVGLYYIFRGRPRDIFLQARKCAAPFIGPRRNPYTADQSELRRSVRIAPISPNCADQSVLRRHLRIAPA